MTIVIIRWYEQIQRELINNVKNKYNYQIYAIVHCNVQYMDILIMKSKKMNDSPKIIKKEANSKILQTFKFNRSFCLKKGITIEETLHYYIV